MLREVRRIVTGHDAQGRSIVAQDGPPPRSIDVGGRGVMFHEHWHALVPARLDRASAEPQEQTLSLEPPKGGVRIRFVDTPPEDPNAVAPDAALMKQVFTAIGAPNASRYRPGETHPAMHVTSSLDFGVVLEGEITLITDTGETLCRAGDVIVQNGTSHAWANRSGKAARMCFVLIDGEHEEGLAP
jgi:quercetin dioxygenase-like cupin family protein